MTQQSAQQMHAAACLDSPSPTSDDQEEDIELHRKVPQQPRTSEGELQGSACTGEPWPSRHHS